MKAISVVLPSIVFVTVISGLLRPGLGLPESPGSFARGASSAPAADKQLADAIRRGNLAATKAAVAAGADVNAINDRKMTPIGEAAYLGQAAIVTFLADKGADVNRADGINFTPLMRAAIFGQADAAKALLDHGADPAIKGAGGKDAADYARPSGPNDSLYTGKMAVGKLIEAAAKTRPAAPAAPAATAKPADPPGAAGPPPAVKTDPLAAQPPAPVPLAEKGDLQLNGLYFQISSLAIGGRLQFSYYYYYFLPDGHVFYGMPPGGTVKEQPDAADVAALMKANPKSLGVYKVTGDQITIVYPGGKPEIHKAAIVKKEDLGTIVLHGAWAVRQGRFKDNQTFDARYATTSTIRTGGNESNGGGDRINISSLNTLDFRADGTFNGAGAVDLGVTSKTLDTSSGSKSVDHGKYQISGNTLTLTHSDGKTDVLTAFPQPDKDESPPQHININGATYNHEK